MDKIMTFGGGGGGGVHELIFLRAVFIPLKFVLGGK